MTGPGAGEEGSATEIFLTLLTLGAVLLQGGYYPTVFLLAALILAALLLVRRRASLPVERCLWLMALLYLAASAAQGYQADSLAQAALPGACALFLAAYRTLPGPKRTSLLAGLLAGSGVFAAMALLAFCGLLPLRGAVVSHRLQFTFQYANAAGSWFAAMALLAQDWEDRRLRRLAVPFVTALCLTRSVGALGLYALAQGLRAALGRRERLWTDTVLLNAAGVLFAALLYPVQGWPALPLLALLYGTGWYFDVLLPRLKKLRVHWLCLPAGCAAIGAALVSRRFSSSLGTFAERLVQIADGLRGAAAHPLLGFGAGNWAQVVPHYQSAQYVSAVVHSAPVQILVDAGVPALLAAGAFLALAWRQRGRTRSQSLAAGVLVLHSLLDFTLQFFPIGALLLALLFAGEAPEGEPVRADWRRAPALLLAGGLCLWLLWGEMETKQLTYAAQRGDWSAAAERYEDRRFLFGGSRKARHLYVYALHSLGEPARVLAATEDVGALEMEEILLRAQALEDLGDREGACRLLLSQLEEQLCQPVFFQRTAALLLEWEADDETVAAYNTLAERANETRSALSALMGNQVYIDHID